MHVYTRSRTPKSAPHRNTKSEEAIAMLHVVTCISLLCKIPGLTWRLWLQVLRPETWGQTGTWWLCLWARHWVLAATPCPPLHAVGRNGVLGARAGAGGWPACSSFGCPCASWPPLTLQAEPNRAEMSQDQRNEKSQCYELWACSSRGATPSPACGHGSQSRGGGGGLHGG